MPPVGGAYARYVLGLLVVIYAINFIDRQIISILAEDIKHDLHLTDAELGFLYGTAFAVFYALFGIPLGRLADNWVRVRLLSAGLAVWSAMTVLSGLASGFGQLSAARIGVGIGEASASPAAYSMLSDWFPRERRATALAIYSSGLYLVGGVSLLIGALVVRWWNAHYPGGGPLGLVGWQAAFLAVGLPGLVIAAWVATLIEPVRGRSDGLPPPPPPVADVGRRFWDDLSSVLPPLTFFHIAQFGRAALARNIVTALGFALLAVLLILLVGNWPQWVSLGLGAYAVASWAQSLKQRDPPAYALIWGTPTFMLALVAFGSISFVGYASQFWAVPYVLRTFIVPMAAHGVPPWYATKDFAALTLGGVGSAGGFIGVITGGWLGDRARRWHPAGRIPVAALAALVPIPFYIAMFTTNDIRVFFLCYVPCAIFGSCYVGIAAATGQDLVLPRMRGAATATYFIGTTLIGLGLGPYFAGAVSKVTGSLATGILSLLVVAPLTLTCLALVWRKLPAAEASRIDRARAAGELI